jgi:hypothetical protein
MIATHTQPLRFDEEFSQTYPIAVLIPSITQIVGKNPQLVFHDSWDDLDYLKYCILDLSPGNVIALVCHERSPVPGVDVCVDISSKDFSKLLVSTLCILNFTDQDLSWVHPDYLPEFQQQWRSRSEAKQIF